MTKEELDLIGAMNMCDEISNEAYRKIMCHCEEQQPCEDCISRAEVIDFIDNMPSELTSDGRRMVRRIKLSEFITDMPSVYPKAKVGHWINHNGETVELDINGFMTDSSWCSKCGEWLTGSDEYRCKGRFCPNCGAKMEGAIDE